MSTVVDTTDDFDRDFKKLAKRHRSLPKDLKSFVAELKEKKVLGIELSPSVFKYRIGIQSKGGGKSGGARIITYELILAEVAEDIDKKIYLLTIYDKSDKSSMSDAEIKDLLKRAELDT